MLLLMTATVGVTVASFAVVFGLGIRERYDIVTAALAVPLLLVTSLLKVLLLVGLFRPLPVLAGSIALAFGAVAWIRLSPGARDGVSRALADLPRRLRLPFAPWAWLVGVVVVGEYAYRLVFGVRFPVHDIDGLWYHVVSVAGWVRTGSLAPPIDGLSKADDLGWLVASDTYPRDSELVSSWPAVFTHNAGLVQVPRIVFVALLMSATYGICRRVGSSGRIAFVAAAAVVLAPSVLVQAGGSYIDIDIDRAAAPAAAWQFLLAAFPDRRDAESSGGAGGYRWLALAGCLFGLAVGIKASNVYLLAAAVPAVVALWWLHNRTGSGGVIRLLPGLVTVVVAAGLVGSYWYVRNWARWGSPLWPFKIGPFDGPHTVAEVTDGVNIGWRPPGPALVAAWRSWLAAVPQVGHRVWYAEWTGGLGLAWAVVMIPLIVVLVLATRWHARAVFGVVLPILAGTLADPSAWLSRYSIPLLVPGAVAFAALVGADHPAWNARSLASLRPLAVPVLVGIVLVGAWGATRYVNFRPDEDPHQGIRAVVHGMRQPAAVRRNLGIWGRFPGLRELPKGSRIGFCAEDAPQYGMPLVLIGADFRASLVDLGTCGSVQVAVARMHSRRSEYIWLETDSPVAKEILAHPSVLVEIPSSVPGSPEYERSRLFRLHDASVVPLATEVK